MVLVVVAVVVAVAVAIVDVVVVVDADADCVSDDTADVVAVTVVVNVDAPTVGNSAIPPSWSVATSSGWRSCTLSFAALAVPVHRGAGMV